jgi:hypothetical protein
MRKQSHRDPPSKCRKLAGVRGAFQLSGLPDGLLLDRSENKRQTKRFALWSQGLLFIEHTSTFLAMRGF